METNLRHITVVGRAGQDAARDDKNPKVVRWGIAVSQWNPETKQEEVVWVNCSAFDRAAEIALKHVKKGQRVFATGKHTVYNGTNGAIDQLNVKSLGSASQFFVATSEDEDEESW